jgi:hypothetical protein
MTETADNGLWLYSIFLLHFFIAHYISHQDKAR